jgi:hypothetical protein
MNRLRWLWCILVVFLAVPLAAQEGGKALQLKVSDDNQDVKWSIGDELVADYHTRGFAKPIFWPVLAPGGVPLTRDWPMIKDGKAASTDHVHQKSLWFCHGDVIPEGVELKRKIKGVDGVDFWSEAAGHGEIVCTRVQKPRVDGGHGVLSTHNEWRTADGTKILDEDRTIHFYDLGKARLMVWRIDLLASVVPITFGDTKEGALGVRVSDAIRAGKFGKGKIENAQGKVGEKECWGQVSDWCDYSGVIDGKTVGLAIFADPKNAYPSCWHVRDYGLMAANPFGRQKSAFPGAAGRKDLVHLSRGQHLQMRYGILLHGEDATGGQVAEHYQRFVKLREKE